MKKALIDLDLLNAEIKENSGHTGYEAALIDVRSKCEPVEDVKTLSVIGKANKKYSGLLYGEPKDLPTKCLLDWESAKYCHNDNACELCKTK